MNSSPKILRDLIRSIWPGAKRYEYFIPMYPAQNLTMKEAAERAGGKYVLDHLLEKYPNLLKVMRIKAGTANLIYSHDLDNALAKFNLDQQCVRTGMKKSLDSLKR